MSTLAVGLMSGTSLDGVDAALVRIDQSPSVTLVGFHTAPYAAEDRQRILDAILGGTARDLALLNVWLGERFSAAVEGLLEQVRIHPRELSFIATHGQTIWHEPGRATLQLGDPAVLAERFSVTVVSDFRSRDVAAGGQGAPLVPIADALLFAHPAHPRALLNIGGMANVTWVPRRGSTTGVLAFDTGPGVAVLDAVVRKLVPGAAFDENGARGGRGEAVSEVVDELLADGYFAAPPPKSTGRERFGEPFANHLMERVRARRRSAGVDDVIATALDLTVRSIADQFRRWLPPGAGRDVLVAGGGARNAALLKRLGDALESWDLRLFGDEFFDGDAKEAVAFAFLGWLALEHRAGNVPEATGARGPRVLGRVTPP